MNKTIKTPRDLFSHSELESAKDANVSYASKRWWFEASLIAILLSAAAFAQIMT